MIDAKYLQNFRENGRRMAVIRDQLVAFAQIHHSKEAVELEAQKLIKAAGGEPAFMKVTGYHWATCINVNDEIVHGIPQGNFYTGDLVTIDSGMFWRGTTSDTATTFTIGEPSVEQAHFMNVGRKTLKKAIKAAVAGNKVGDISKVIQTSIEKAGFNVVRTLTGHGIGKTMHEAPAIPCFISSDPVLRTKLTPGMVLAIEVMYTAGGWRLVTDKKDRWTMRTADGSLSAVYEDDIIVMNHESEIITQSPLVPPLT